MLQLWLITAMKPLMAVRAPLIIIISAANAIHPVQPVGSAGVRGEVGDGFKLVLDMVAPSGLHLVRCRRVPRRWTALAERTVSGLRVARGVDLFITPKGWEGPTSEPVAEPPLDTGGGRPCASLRGGSALPCRS